MKNKFIEKTEIDPICKRTQLCVDITGITTFEMRITDKSDRLFYKNLKVKDKLLTNFYRGIESTIKPNAGIIVHDTHADFSIKLPLRKVCGRTNRQ